MWERRFARDPDIIGRPIVIDGVGREVVGVMPAAFRFPDPDLEVWVPLHNDATDTPRYWAGDFMPVVGRLRDGAPIEQAREELAIFQQRVRGLFPWSMPADWNRDVSFVPLQEHLVAGSQARLILLLGAVFFVLLIACANVANLTIARVMTRSRELVIRSALGAGRGRMVRQLLTESLLLSTLGQRSQAVGRDSGLHRGRGRYGAALLVERGDAALLRRARHSAALRQRLPRYRLARTAA